MLLSPEINFGGLKEAGVSGGRSVVIRLDDLLLLLIAFGWLAKSALHKELGLIKKSPLNGNIYIYTASFIFATGAGVLYGDVEGLLGTFNILKFIEYFLLYFLVLNNLETEKQARNLLKAAIFTSLVIALYAISQIPSGQRVTAPFEGESGEPNTLGGYMLLMVSITLGLFLETEHFLRRIGYGLLSILDLIALFYTESRSSYIGLLFSVIVLAVYAKRRNLLLLGVVLALLFSSVLLPSKVIERINYTFRGEPQQINPFQPQSKIEALDSSTRARLISWQSAFDGWKKYPIFGYGVTGFSFIDAQYMKILVETGVVGIVTFLLLLASIYKNTRKMGNSIAF
jgi:O-antigen ligase